MCWPYPSATDTQRKQSRKTAKFSLLNDHIHFYGKDVCDSKSGIISTIYISQYAWHNFLSAVICSSLFFLFFISLSLFASLAFKLHFCTFKELKCNLCIIKGNYKPGNCIHWIYYSISHKALSDWSHCGGNSQTLWGIIGVILSMQNDSLH